jgi:CheY-specific phosphatase CheX
MSGAIPIHLRDAIVDSFRVQASLPVEVKSIATDVVDESSEEIACMAVLGMRSSHFEGSLALGFPKATFLKLLEHMLGEKYADIDERNADACSEMLNIIYCSARVKINKDGEDFQPAIPTTIRGEHLSIALGNSSRFLNFRCSSNLGSFLVALKLKKV